MAQVVFYTTVNGKSPVEENISKLANPDQAKAYSSLNFLEEHGYRLREPHVKTLKGNLKELRFRIKPGQYRVFFFFHNQDDIVLLHSFIKKTQKTPKTAISTALKRQKDWENRAG
ncbi:MAG: type II toxin-antitoxin system RelE/ParE family toxin [Fibrobacteria bacterium]|nr:type II toxin-antitoxin system RelE/ParE family toxin [Fibrobacteria bacterium]